MRLRPTLRAKHLSIVGIGATALGIAVTHPAMTAYGAAILIGVACGRALTRVSVARARSAGFEMLWLSSEPFRRLSRGQELVLRAELRNRDTLPTRFRHLDVAHGPGLRVTCSPNSGEVPAGGKLVVTVHVEGLRVGLHGIFNLTLQTIRAPGLYTVPLSFSNPFVVEILPKVGRLGLSPALGGRARSSSPLSRKGRLQGDGTELRELRDHRPGDAYRKIAWKASARRGRLLIIEREQEQSDVVWVILDASVDSCSGAVGSSPIDGAIDQAATTIEAHLSRGDRVGLAIMGTRILYKLPPARGPKHAAALISALTLKTHTADSDRSDWDEADVARRALEHATTLDSRAASVKPFEYEKLSAIVSDLQARAPTQAETPFAPSLTERRFRRYLLSFGIQAPPRGISDRHRAEREIAQLLQEIQKARPRPSLVYLFAKPPSFETPKQLLESLARLVARRVEVRFTPLEEDLTGAAGAARFELIDPARGIDVKADAVLDALSYRQRLAAEEGMQQLARLGVRAGRTKQGQKRRTFPES